MGFNALACGECGAGLPPADATGTSICVYCGTEHRERSSEVLAAAIQPPPPSSGALVSDRPSWHDGEDAARIPMTEEAVLHLVRQHFGDADSVFVCPHVPPKREQAARRAHVVHLPPRERILALYDATWFGGGDEGFLVTAKRLCWRNAGEPACSILWQDIDPDRLYVEPGRVVVGDDAILVAEDSLLDPCANAFHVLALSGHLWGLPASPTVSGAVPAQGARGSEPTGSRLPATPPPAHTTSYHGYAMHAETQAPDFCCWHCRTPLYKTTPRCSYCGAFPKKKGWLRAG